MLVPGSAAFSKVKLLQKYSKLLGPSRPVVSRYKSTLRTFKSTKPNHATGREPF